MAENNNPIYASQLYIDDGAIEKAIKQWTVFYNVTVKSQKDLIATAKELQKTIKDANVTQKEGQDLIIENTKHVEKIQRELLKTQKDKIEVEKKLEQLTREQVKTQQQREKSIQKEKDAVDALNKTVREAERLYKNLYLTKGKDDEATKKAFANATNLKKQQDDLNRSMGRYTDNVGKYGSAITDSFSGLVKGITIGSLISSAIQSTAGVIKDFVNGATDAFKESEHQAHLLKFAVTDIGKEGLKGFEELTKQAEELMGAFDDEEIKKAQVALINYGLSVEQTKKLIPLLLDTSIQTGRSLDEVATSALRGIEGQTKALKPLGVAFTDTGNKTENFNILLDKLSKFSGAAEASLETETGQIKALEIQLKESQEVMGKSTIKLQLLWIEWKKAAIDTFMGIGTALKFLFDKSGYIADKALEQQKLIVDDWGKTFDSLKKIAEEKGKSVNDIAKGMLFTYREDLIKAQAKYNEKANDENTKTLAQARYNYNQILKLSVEKEKEITEKKLGLTQKGEDQLKAEREKRQKEKEEEEKKYNDQLLKTYEKAADLSIKATEIYYKKQKEERERQANEEINQSLKNLSKLLKITFDSEESKNNIRKELFDKYQIEDQQAKDKYRADEKEWLDLLLRDRIISQKEYNQAMLKLNGTWFDKLKESLLKIVGLTSEQVKSASQAASQAISTTLGYIQQTLQLQIQAIDDLLQKQLAAKDEEIKIYEEKKNAAKDWLQNEIDAKNAGLAHNVKAAQLEYINNKKLQEKAEKDRKALEAKAVKDKAAYQKQIQKIESLEQTSSMISASAGVLAGFSKLPQPYGIIAGVIAVGAMWASFLSYKSKAKELNKETYAEGTYEELRGGSHASGNDISLGIKSNGKERRAEGGEALAIIKKRSTQKYRGILPDIIDSLNKGVFENKYTKAFDTDGLINTIVVNQQFGELQTISDNVSALRKNSEVKRYTDHLGRLVEQRGNNKRIYKN